MVTRKGQHPARGQAAVETVLGLGIFITVLIFGLHFAELTHLSLKTHEAMAAAAWDATAWRVERPGVDGAAWYDASRLAVPRSRDAANERYADWDGRRSTTGTTGPKQVFTRATGLDTTCTRDLDTNNTFSVAAIANVLPYGEPGAIRCVSQGSVSAINIPTDFLQKAEGGFFKEEHVRRNTFSLCGLGRASGGTTCQGALSVLLGDHGLTSGDNRGEERTCELLPDDIPGISCANPVFYGLAHQTWNNSFGWTRQPEDYARDVTGSAPDGRVTGFYLSFQDASASFGESHERLWQTTPMDYNNAGGTLGTYRQAYTSSSFLKTSATATRFVYLGRYSCE